MPKKEVVKKDDNKDVIKLKPENTETGKNDAKKPTRPELKEGVGKGLSKDNKENKTPQKEEYSVQEKEIIRRNRAKSKVIIAAKEKIDKILQEHKCILKINPNSPIGAPQIVVDLQ